MFKSYIKIKRLRQIGLLAVLTLWLGLLSFTQCKKLNSVLGNDSIPNFIDFIHQNPQLTLLSQCIRRAGLTDSLRMINGITFFAPVDSAFVKVGLDSSKINFLSPTQLRTIVLYHMVKGQIPSNFIQSFSQIGVTTLSPYIATLEKNNYGIFLNGSAAISLDNSTANGIVDLIKGFNFPPIVDLYQTINSDPSLSLLSIALRRVKSLKDNLDSRGVYTFFAPNNLAFNKAHLIDSLHIYAVDSVFLDSQIRKGFFTPIGFTSDFLGSSFNLISLDPNAVNIGTSLNGLSLQTSHFDDPSLGVTRIVQANQLTNNGVLHRIDGFL